MRIALLVIAGCPHAEPAARLLRQALDDAGLIDESFTTEVIASRDQADLRGFSGSPTYVVDGLDPFDSSAAAPSLSCRLYDTRSGLRGLPDREDLRAALEHAAGSPDRSGRPVRSPRRG